MEPYGSWTFGSLYSWGLFFTWNSPEYFQWPDYEHRTQVRLEKIGVLSYIASEILFDNRIAYPVSWSCTVKDFSPKSYFLNLTYFISCQPSLFSRPEKRWLTVFEFLFLFSFLCCLLFYWLFFFLEDNIKSIPLIHSPWIPSTISGPPPPPG